MKLKQTNASAHFVQYTAIQMVSEMILIIQDTKSGRN